MAYKEVRTLHADEIECRIGQIGKDGKGLSLLLYKDARCDMNILDETFGPLNWQRHHSRDNANCVISVWDPEKNQWIEKEDTGSDSNMEAEKGRASDACKRSCVNWGIGRELYTAPFIWVPADKCTIVNGRCFDKFDVSVIEYDEYRRISALVIINEKTGEVVFSFRKAAQSAKKQPQKKAQSKPTPMPAPMEGPAYHCSDCGSALVPTRSKDGAEMSPKTISEFSIGRYGRVLCPACVRKIEALKKKPA